MAALITHDDRQPFIEDGCVVIRDGSIAAVGPTAELRQRIPPPDSSMRKAA